MVRYYFWGLVLFGFVLGGFFCCFLVVFFLQEQDTEAMILLWSGVGSGKCRKLCRLGHRTPSGIKTLGCSHRTARVILS